MTGEAQVGRCGDGVHYHCGTCSPAIVLDPKLNLVRAILYSVSLSPAEWGMRV